MTVFPKTQYRNSLPAKAAHELQDELHIVAGVLVERLEALIEVGRQNCPECQEEYHRTCKSCNKRHVKDRKDFEWPMTQAASSYSTTLIGGLIGGPYTQGAIVRQKP